MIFQEKMFIVNTKVQIKSNIQELSAQCNHQCVAKERNFLRKSLEYHSYFVNLPTKYII